MDITRLYGKLLDRLNASELIELYGKLSRSLFDECKIADDFVSPIEVKRVIFNPPATIIMWSDNTKTVVKCQDGDTYDKEKGFALAYLKKTLGNDNTFNKVIHKWIPVDIGEAATETISKPTKVLNGRVRCVESPYDWWTVGRVYEVVNGILIADDGDEFPCDDKEPYRDYEDIRHAGRAHGDWRHNEHNTFVPVED